MSCTAFSGGLTPRDIAALHAYEQLHQGRYDVRHLPVRPEPYVQSVERWSASRWTGARVIDAGEGA